MNLRHTAHGIIREESSTLTRNGKEVDYGLTFKTNRFAKNLLKKLILLLRKSFRTSRILPLSRFTDKIDLLVGFHN